LTDARTRVRTARENIRYYAEGIDAAKPATICASASFQLAGYADIWIAALEGFFKAKNEGWLSSVLVHMITSCSMSRNQWLRWMMTTWQHAPAGVGSKPKHRGARPLSCLASRKWAALCDEILLFRWP
jgi:hypothetical protein